MAKVKKIGRVTFRKLTDEEARAKYGSSFVFVARPMNAQRAEEGCTLVVRCHFLATDVE